MKASVYKLYLQYPLTGEKNQHCSFFSLPTLSCNPFNLRTTTQLLWNPPWFRTCFWLVGLLWFSHFKIPDEKPFVFTRFWFLLKETSLLWSYLLTLLDWILIDIGVPMQSWKFWNLLLMFLRSGWVWKKCCFSRLFFLVEFLPFLSKDKNLIMLEKWSCGFIFDLPHHTSILAFHLSRFCFLTHWVKTCIILQLQRISWMQ